MKAIDNRFNYTGGRVCVKSDQAIPDFHLKHKYDKMFDSPQIKAVLFEAFCDPSIPPHLRLRAVQVIRVLV